LPLRGRFLPTEKLGGDGQQGQYRDRTDEIRRRGGKLLKEQ
jgi:hypothetical protein